MPTFDVLFLLERHGYRRPLNRINLTAAGRETILQRIREDRLARGDTPVYSPEYAARAAIASERIEEGDARAWLTGNAAEPDH